MTEKKFITAQELLEESLNLGAKILHSDSDPTLSWACGAAAAR